MASKAANRLWIDGVTALVEIICLHHKRQADAGESYHAGEEANGYSNVDLKHHANLTYIQC